MEIAKSLEIGVGTVYKALERVVYRSGFQMVLNGFGYAPRLMGQEWSFHALAVDLLRL